MPHANTIAVILAAGKGTRMHSDKPKALQTLLGETMLGCVAATAAQVAASVLTVVGHGHELVRKAHPELAEGFVLQAEQKGTGHALQAAWERVRASGATHCLVLNADAPLVTPQDLDELMNTAREGADIAFLSAVLPDAGSFGRVLRGDDGEVTGIVEAKDFDPAQHGQDTGEVNTGLFCLSVAAVEAVLFSLTSANRAGEYYITDLVAHGVAAGMQVHALRREAALDLLGVNSPLELAQAEERLRSATAQRLLESGVLLHHPESVVVGPRAVVEPGAELTGPCRVLGASVVSRGARLGAFSQITDSVLEPGCEVREHCHLQGAHLSPGSDCGPFARLRPGAELRERAHVGNFVEMKKSVLGPGAKAGHLSYLGDAQIGAGANIGAGTITCNYDGVNKHATHIGANSFIGSNTALVAPVKVGANALVGAGSVITKDVPDQALAIARGKQSNLERRGKKS
ncbi:MAG TPA: bifunctional UDP-N-acetylglucosamine diphosphorylase/glucosamine-1-phosphate N-acetyltransferase GlmU [Humidesulfovibrio sp.]|uniref:bifunctional UDP-N-acetylglucosamine diphosphorylase/glucosamine-1-phosphate N-acetyltransferase GlmU n=1 Tax=Humidesulfovibrio sp. TaxID=2910988 RepID=UPI002C4B1E7E|nr:bifunctional UDP-N-acetylglucosamine diphosphorylase/glucosamine-1-phosphate N-acetyltransferase GlmU [Humidesulfovibrio sp.]HWR04437.1 bifunctional UDP-N-acetylglucosamine diphosphorylase/glucosamine-1-phosphate N-acetyltransferase GlmU [Humidesulfovibrio sp.]